MGRRIEEKAETSPLHPTFFPGSNSLLYFQLFYLFLTPQQCRRMGNGHCNEFITLQLCHSFLFTLFPISSTVGSLPQDAILRELIPREHPTGCSSASTIPKWLHTMGPILQALLLPTAPHGALQ